jgi:hypothetical protein
LPEDALEFFRAAGRRGGKIGGSKGGKIGGKRSLETMTPAERTERARKAAAASAKVRSAKAQAKGKKG